MKNIFSKFIALIFILFALMNINDPDGFIWVPVYVTVAFLPLTSIEKVSVRLLKFCSLFLFIVGTLMALGLLNSIMPWQADDRMGNLWEHQREGLGLILGAAWFCFGHRLK
ncbi:MAG: transmembrane 220 family protein [Candidatus Marinimicrobia bacterium]|nr:transmembrane 220 family protein [Candidatus Neomarinimicrobiota bacterium]